MARELSKIMVFGGTGYIGRHIVRASVSIGHPTYVYARPLDHNSSLSKVETHKEFESMGVTIVQGELSEKEKLVSIMKQVDIVISAMSTPQVMEQLKIIDAIKAAGTIKRFIPSDFGCDEDKIKGLPPFQALLDDKKSIRKVIEAAGIPYTYVSSTIFATYFLSFLRHPPEASDKETIIIYGSGEAKVSLTCEKDVGLYTIKVATDQRTRNRAVMCRPPKNIVSQVDLALLWEAKTGRRYKKVHILEKELVKLSETLPHPKKVRAAILHSIFVAGSTTVETSGDDLEVSLLYPEFTYTTVGDIIDELLINPPKFQYIEL